MVGLIFIVQLAFLMRKNVRIDFHNSRVLLKIVLCNEVKDLLLESRVFYYFKASRPLVVVLKQQLRH